MISFNLVDGKIDRCETRSNTPGNLRLALALCLSILELTAKEDKAACVALLFLSIADWHPRESTAVNHEAVAAL